MNILNKMYNGENKKEILKLLLKKIREHNLSVIVLCENLKIAAELSIYLWNFSIPHYLEGDEYLEKNNIFISDKIKSADELICYENCSIENINKFKKCSFIGKNHVMEGEYWLYNGKKWHNATKEQYYF